MTTTDFIQVIITDKDGTKSTRYVNKTHIQQVYEKNGIIYLELTGYDVLEIHNEQIAVLMDRFIR